MNPARQVYALFRRNLLHTVRQPLSLSDVTFLPVFFTLLFVYVLGSGVGIPGESYHSYSIPGLMLLNLTTAAITTAVGLSVDLSSGAVARFRTLPMWQGSVLLARTLSDLVSSAICVVVVAVTGLIVGWRPHASVRSVIAGFAIALLYAYALSWFSACLGIASAGPESTQGIGLVLFFPTALVSNALVPTDGMPSWMRPVANWSPVSTTTSALRDLLGNRGPTPTHLDWPTRHPIDATLLWVAILLGVCIPLAGLLYRRRTSR
ncbi:MAG TPA: ABC transporter permease [Sporichthyaceae bacterium]|nr:ABC transporter permease [Sporichthyaceae bacterium]